MFEDKSFGLKMGGGNTSPFAPRVDLLKAGAALLPQLRKSAKRKAARQRQVEDRQYGLQLTNQAIGLQSNIASQKQAKASFGLGQSQLEQNQSQYLGGQEHARKMLALGSTNQVAQANTLNENKVGAATVAHARNKEIEDIKHGYGVATAEREEQGERQGQAFKMLADAMPGATPQDYANLEVLAGDNPNMGVGGLMQGVSEWNETGQQPMYGPRPKDPEHMNMADIINLGAEKGVPEEESILQFNAQHNLQPLPDRLPYPSSDIAEKMLLDGSIDKMIAGGEDMHNWLNTAGANARGMDLESLINSKIQEYYSVKEPTVPRKSRYNQRAETKETLQSRPKVAGRISGRNARASANRTSLGLTQEPTAVTVPSRKSRRDGYGLQ